MTRHLAVIPARGGSKRLPRKNVLDFLGKPIITYTIEAARDAGIFNRVVVSTEDAEIAEIAKKHGGDVDVRPASLATDAATIKDVCIELLDRLEKSGEKYDTLSVLYATAPLRNADDIRETHKLLADGKCDFAMGITEFVQPVHQVLTQSAIDTMVPVFPDQITLRASDVKRYFAGNGSTYCVNVAAFRKAGSFAGQPLRGHVMPRERSVDIDTQPDFELAEFYAKRARA